MSGTCEGCQHWQTGKVVRYASGDEIKLSASPPGKGECAKLGITTEKTFGCNRFDEAQGDRTDITFKPGAPWQHWTMIKCPHCAGRGSGLGERGTGCYHCVGTGKVRKYDDGFVGEERTRKHPKEIELEKANQPVPSLDGIDSTDAAALAVRIKELETQIAQMRSSPMMQARARAIESSGPVG
jgi:hypothetical protein